MTPVLVVIGLELAALAAITYWAWTAPVMDDDFDTWDD